MSTLFPDAYPKPYPGSPSGVGTFAPGHQYASSTPASTLLDGLISYWKLDEESGTRYDSVGTNHLTDNNTVGFVAGVNGNAASFVAANSEYLSAAASLLNTSAWATSFWFNSASASKILFLDGTAETYLLFTSGGTATMYVATDGSPNYTGHTVTLALPTGWVHLIIEVDSSGITSTLNGVTSSTTPLNGNLRSGAATFKVGSSGTGFFMDGKADEVAIWSRVLTADERAELYAAGAGKFYPFT